VVGLVLDFRFFILIEPPRKGQEGLRKKRRRSVLAAMTVLEYLYGHEPVSTFWRSAIPMIGWIPPNRSLALERKKDIMRFIGPLVFGLNQRRSMA
jgi:hypothetical protein